MSFLLILDGRSEPQYLRDQICFARDFISSLIILLCSSLRICYLLCSALLQSQFSHFPSKETQALETPCSGVFC